MNDSKLIQTLKLLTTEEKEALKHYLHSPFFFGGKTASSDTISLFQYLVQQLQDTPHSVQLEKEAVYKGLFGNAPIIKGKLEKLMSRLQKAIEGFIKAYTFKEESSLEQEKRILLFYKRKKAEKYFQKSVTHFQSLQKKSTYKPPSFFFNEYWLERERCEHFLLNNMRKGDLNLISTINQLDIFYLSARLELLNKLFAQKKYQVKLDIGPILDSLKQLTAFIENAHFQDIPQIQLNYKILQFLAFDQSKHYHALVELTETYRTEIPKDQLKELATLFRNYCIWQYNRGQAGYLQKAFDLYQQHLEQGLLFYGDGLLPSTFKNIVDAGLKCEQYEWVFQFLQEYKGQIINTPHETDVYNYNLANYYFHRHNYEKALDLLSHQYQDVYYKIDARRLELKIYYELNSPILEARLEAFRILVLRLAKGKITKVQSEGNKQFALILMQILHSKTLFNKDRIAKIKRNVNDRLVADKGWFLEKLELLSV